MVALHAHDDEAWPEPTEVVALTYGSPGLASHPLSEENTAFIVQARVTLPNLAVVMSEVRSILARLARAAPVMKRALDASELTGHAGLSVRDFRSIDEMRLLRESIPQLAQLEEEGESPARRLSLSAARAARGPWIEGRMVLEDEREAEVVWVKSPTSHDRPTPNHVIAITHTPGHDMHCDAAVEEPATARFERALVTNQHHVANSRLIAKMPDLAKSISEEFRWVSKLLMPARSSFDAISELWECPLDLAARSAFEIAVAQLLKIAASLNSREW
jgi:hypothetical protein